MMSEANMLLVPLVYPKVILQAGPGDGTYYNGTSLSEFRM